MAATMREHVLLATRRVMRSVTQVITQVVHPLDQQQQIRQGLKWCRYERWRILLLSKLSNVKKNE